MSLLDLKVTAFAIFRDTVEDLRSGGVLREVVHEHRLHRHRIDGTLVINTTLQHQEDLCALIQNASYIGGERDAAASELYDLLDGVRNTMKLPDPSTNSDHAYPISSWSPGTTINALKVFDSFDVGRFRQYLADEWVEFRDESPIYLAFGDNIETVLDSLTAWYELIRSAVNSDGGVAIDVRSESE
ncbi:MAG: hypothetical protein AAF585_07080 [Verrucomicrobiota bacterium]